MTATLWDFQLKRLLACAADLTGPDPIKSTLARYHLTKVACSAKRSKQRRIARAMLANLCNIHYERRRA